MSLTLKLVIPFITVLLQSLAQHHGTSLSLLMLVQLEREPGRAHPHTRQASRHHSVALRWHAGGMCLQDMDVAAGGTWGAGISPAWLCTVRPRPHALLQTVGETAVSCQQEAYMGCMVTGCHLLSCPYQAPITALLVWWEVLLFGSSKFRGIQMWRDLVERFKNTQLLSDRYPLYTREHSLL